MWFTIKQWAIVLVSSIAGNREMWIQAKLLSFVKIRLKWLLDGKTLTNSNGSNYVCWIHAVWFVELYCYIQFVSFAYSFFIVIHVCYLLSCKSCFGKYVLFIYYFCCIKWCAQFHKLVWLITTNKKGHRDSRKLLP